MIPDKKKLKDFRESLNLSQQEFVDKIGMSLSAVSMVECGKRNISKTVKERIKQVFNYDIDKQEYITQKEFVTVTSNIIPVPFYHVKAAANPKGELLLDYTEEEALFFDKRWLKNVLGVSPYNCSIIQAKGDSMDSGMGRKDDIKDGDLLLVDNSCVDIVNNRIYIIELVASSELLVKKVFQDIKGNVSLISNNEKYPPRVLTEADNAMTLGRVVWNGSRDSL